MPAGVYSTRLACASVCNPGETAGFCTKEPPAGCEVTKQYNYKALAYYYNKYSRTCVEFEFCGPPVNPESNYFTTKTACLLQCSGFPIISNSTE
ncbi:uncharacterized protein LOC144134695 [Amblyomma americanum]